MHVEARVSAIIRPEILVTIGQFKVDNESVLEYNS